MSTSATALLTRLRTWALVAGLTGLVIALGTMIGGTFFDPRDGSRSDRDQRDPRSWRA